MKNIKLFEDWVETENSAHPLSGTPSKPITNSGRADLNAALLIELDKATNIRYGIKTSNESMNIRRVKRLVKQGADIKLKSSRGETILLWAAHFNDVELAQICIKKGIRIDEPDGGGNTPLHWALDNNSLQVALYLVQNGADINKFDENGNKPIHIVAIKGSLELLKLLYQKGADINSETRTFKDVPLHRASSRNKLDIIKFLIQNGANVNAKMIGDLGFTPLHVASVYDCYEATMELINARADVNAKDSLGKTPLHHCSFDSSSGIFSDIKLHKNYPKAAKVANLLIAAGAKRNIKDNNGDTPVDLAMKCDNQELRKVILKKDY